MKRMVYLIRVEIEVGSENGETNYIEGLYATKKLAQKALSAWRRSHDGHRWKDSEGNGWCDCGWSAELEAHQVQDSL